MSNHRHIKLKPREFFENRGVEIPASLWRESPFKFDPQPFALSTLKFEDKIYSESVQEDSLSGFLTDPFEPIIYGVGSAPNDSKSKLFAAYLVQQFLEQAHPSNTVLWLSMAMYNNQEKIREAFSRTPSLIVISGISPNSNNYKLDVLKELLDHHENIPRIVVVSGEDPISFLFGRMYVACNRVFFHSSAIVKRQVQVI